MRILKTSERKEKGIALIFTLIILSLLLILALGFALNSMFDQKAARNAANASFAAFLAQTQLKQVLSLIKNDEANLESSQFYSHDSGSPAVTDTDMLQERLTVTDLLPVVDTAKVNWSYIRSQDLEKRIIGRTAFVVIANGIPLGSLVDGRIGTTVYQKHNEKDDTETRIGKYVSEINVRAAVPVTSSVRSAVEMDNMTTALNWSGDSSDNTVPGFTGGEYTGIWDNFSVLFKVIDTAMGAGLSDTQKKEFIDNLSIVSAKDKEAFWADTNGDTVIDSNELYKRFDLTRDWETASHAEDLTFIKDKILLTTGTVPDIDMESFTEADSDSNSKGLPWLACFGYKDDGTFYTLAELDSTFPSISAHRMQIAANLKDYCDNDSGASRPTSDVDPVTWLTLPSPAGYVHPTFTGNEKTPYINKIGVRVEVMQSETYKYTDPGPPVEDYYDVSASINIYPAVELINIYGQNWTSNLRVTVEGSANITTTVNGVSQPLDHAFSCVIPVNTTDWKTTGYSDLKMGAVTPFANINEKTDILNRSISVVLNKVTFNKVVLHNAAAPAMSYDYVSNLENTENLPLTVFTGAGNGTPTNYAWIGSAVHDPRQNLNDGDWKDLTPSTTDNPTTIFSLITGASSYEGASNASATAPYPTISPSTVDLKYDLEIGDDPANSKLSTAHIRDGAIESPWELGFIHRGAKWQTLNLKTCDSLKAYKTISIGTAPNIKKYLAGGGDYASGDANILDQIKMTAKAQSQQKINLKSQKTTTFDALFTKVKLGCGIDSAVSIGSIATGVSPAGTDIDLSAVDYTNMRTAIMAFFKTAGTANRTRAGIAGQLVLPAGAASDAAKEELIGKIINLTEVNGKVGSFTIIILAQMIKDVGGPVGSPVSISKYSGDTLTSGTQGCEIGVFNADINDINDSKKNIYYDEITAEQKIIVKGYRDISGVIKITNFQYVD